MASENDKKGVALIRTVEERLVWLVAFAATRVSHPNAGVPALAESADKGLAEYTKRFAPLTPTDFPE